MTKKDFALNDIVEMKKGHPCGENKWKNIRLGMDIRIKCRGCERSVIVTGKEIELNDIEEMKKGHTCEENKWKIIRLGMDIRIKCQGCERSVMLHRKEFEKKLKRVLIKHEE